MVLLSWNFSGCPGIHTQQRLLAMGQPVFQHPPPSTQKSPRQDQDKAWTRVNLPSPKSACSQRNECFRQQHTFPFPQNCSLPIRHLELGLAPQTKLRIRITFDYSNSQELLQFGVSLYMIERHPFLPMQGGENKTVGRRAETRPRRERWRTKPCFFAMGSRRISCP